MGCSGIPESFYFRLSRGKMRLPRVHGLLAEAMTVAGLVAVGGRRYV